MTSTSPRQRGSRRCSSSWVGSISPSVITIVTTAISSEYTSAALKPIWPSRRP